MIHKNLKHFLKTINDYDQLTGYINDFNSENNKRKFIRLSLKNDPNFIPNIKNEISFIKKNIITKQFEQIKDKFTTLNFKEDKNVIMLFSNSIDISKYLNFMELEIDKIDDPASFDNKCSECEQILECDKCAMCQEYDEYVIKFKTVKELAEECKSVVISKSTLKIISTQYYNIKCNEDATSVLKNCNWNNVKVQECYEGTLIMVFYYEDTWYVSTRRCLDSNFSTWNKNKSHYEMFSEAICDKFDVQSLDKKYFYHFILIHHQNKNIIDYGRLKSREDRLKSKGDQLKGNNDISDHSLKTEHNNISSSSDKMNKIINKKAKNVKICKNKGGVDEKIFSKLISGKNSTLVNDDGNIYSHKNIIHTFTGKISDQTESLITIDNVKKIEDIKFSSYKDLIKKLKEIDELNRKITKITTEGFIIKFHSKNNKISSQDFKMFKLQTDVYKILSYLKPNNPNISQCFLQLYQENKLLEVLPYFTRFSKEIMFRIDKSIRTISKEMLHLYHITRQKKNRSIYDSLPKSYKSTLYHLHGLYIENKKKQLTSINSSSSKINKKIFLNDVNDLDDIDDLDDIVDNLDDIVDNNNNYHHDNYDDNLSDLGELGNLLSEHNNLSNLNDLNNNNNNNSYNNNIHNNNNNKISSKVCDIANSSKNRSMSINAYDVYDYFKKLNPLNLKKIYYDREMLKKNDESKYIINCIYTSTQTYLMFGEI